MELGETDFSKLLEARQGTAISLPWITLYFRQVCAYHMDIGIIDF